MSRKAIPVVLIALGFAFCGSAWAQNAPSDAGGPLITPTYGSNDPEDIPVMQRPRPEYDAKGIPLGGFRLFPDLALDESYDDNVFRLQNAQSDYVFHVAPSLRLSSQWARNMLDVYAGLSNYDYSKFGQLNLTDWNAGADGRLDITGASSIYANGAASELHEAMSSPNVVGFQKSPSRYYLYHADANAMWQPNRFRLDLGGTFDRYDWMSTPLIGGGTLNNRDRNVDDYQAYAKGSYFFTPGTGVFLRATYDSRQYDLSVDRSGLDRSSNGYRIDGGLALQITHLVHGEIYAGYLDQKFKTPLPNVSGVDYGVQLDWLLSPLVTVHLAGARELNATILNQASVEDDKSVVLSADYELLRNIIVSPRAGYVYTTFPGISRHDRSPEAGIGVRYLINRYMSAYADYAYTERSTNAPGLGFHDNTVSLGLSFHV